MVGFLSLRVLYHILLLCASLFCSMKVIFKASDRSTKETTAQMIVVATVPVLCVYPFAQKDFVKDVMMGSLKVE